MRNPTIDIAKLVAAFLVVGIHTAVFKDVNPDLYFVFNLLICRLAVPFFAATTGYFLASKLTLTPNRVQRLTPNPILWQQERKLLRLYALWTVLYFLFLLPDWIPQGYLTVGNCLGYCKSAVLSGSYFHLWYVLYIIYALPVFCLIVRYLHRRWWLPLAVILWVTYALHYGYSWALPDAVNHALDWVDKGYAPLSAQFVLLPMMLTGASLTLTERQRLTEHQRLTPNLIAFAIAFALLVAEGYFLRHHGVESVTRILMILPVTYCLLNLLLQVSSSKFQVSNPTETMKPSETAEGMKPSASWRNLGRLSLIIYCVHPMFCRYLNDAVGSTVLAWFLVCFLSWLVAFLWIKLTKICKFQ